LDAPFPDIYVSSWSSDFVGTSSHFRRHSLFFICAPPRQVETCGAPLLFMLRPVRAKIPGEFPPRLPALLAPPEYPGPFYATDPHQTKCFFFFSGVSDTHLYFRKNCPWATPLLRFARRRGKDQHCTPAFSSDLLTASPFQTTTEVRIVFFSVLPMLPFPKRKPPRISFTP